jgi:ribonuclease J
MSTIRQYLKQKAARAYHGQKIDLDDLKRELKDDITHILYDQTRRTPIVIPVINEINAGGNSIPTSDLETRQTPVLLRRKPPFRVTEPQPEPTVPEREVGA